MLWGPRYGGKVEGHRLKRISCLPTLLFSHILVQYVFYVVFLIPQQEDSSLEGSQGKKNILIIQAQYKYFSKSYAPTFI
jgi:hypothetical protein